MVKITRSSGHDLMRTDPIPSGFHAVTPYLMVDGVERLIQFLGEVFGAEVKSLTRHPDGSVMHASVQVRDSMLMMSDGRPQWPAVPASFYCYVPNVDELYQRALAAGGTSLTTPADQVYGDRMGGVKDPTGNTWWLATHIRDVSDEEIERNKRPTP